MGVPLFYQKAQFTSFASDFSRFRTKWLRYGDYFVVMTKLVRFVRSGDFGRIRVFPLFVFAGGPLFRTARATTKFEFVRVCDLFVARERLRIWIGGGFRRNLVKFFVRCGCVDAFARCNLLALLLPL